MADQMRLDVVRAMKLYHPTRHSSEILRDGFGESSGAYLTEIDHSGVWLFDQPVNAHIGNDGSDVMLELEIPESVVAPFEWVIGVPYREFLVPAALINHYGPPRVSDEHKL
jgi:hypothetical protein